MDEDHRFVEKFLEEDCDDNQLGASECYCRIQIAVKVGYVTQIYGSDFLYTSISIFGYRAETPANVSLHQ